MRSAVVITLLALSALMPLAPAQASPGSGPTAAVSLGDSYISGEAGRWNGNSITPVGDKDATDRACQPSGLGCSVDKTRVYERGTENAACHRSDVAEIHSARLAVAQRVNIACSGGVTRNIFRASSGGRGQNGERAQGDQLLDVARAKDVRLVVLSVGGNDLGFASIVAACLGAYVSQTGPCEPSQQPRIDARKAQVTADIGKAIDEVRAVMSQAGYTPADYRFVMQTYPSVVPRGSEFRYQQFGAERTANGCPFYDSDANWARDSAAGQIGAVSKAAARSRGIEILDLVNAFQGHEFCSRFAAQSTPFARPTAAGAEWGRFVGASTVQQGELQEAFHPNAYGQRGIGTCLTKVYAAAPGTFECSGAAGLLPDDLALRRTGSFPPNRTCLAARVSLGAKRIGRIGLGTSRRRLGASRQLARVTLPAKTSRRYSYCVKSSRGRVAAVFGRRGRVELVTATAARYGNRGVRPGVRLRTAKRRFRDMVRVRGTKAYRLSRRSRRVIGVRRGRVRYVGVASKRSLRSARALRVVVRRAGL